MLIMGTSLFFTGPHFTLFFVNYLSLFIKLFSIDFFRYFIFQYIQILNKHYFLIKIQAKNFYIFYFKIRLGNSLTSLSSSLGFSQRPRSSRYSIFCKKWYILNYNYFKLWKMVSLYIQLKIWWGFLPGFRISSSLDRVLALPWSNVYYI